MIIRVIVVGERPAFVREYDIETSYELWMILFRHQIYLHHYYCNLNDKAMEREPLPTLKDGDFITLIPKLI